MTVLNEDRLAKRWHIVNKDRSTELPVDETGKEYDPLSGLRSTKSRFDELNDIVGLREDASVMGRLLGMQAIAGPDRTVHTEYPNLDNALYTAAIKSLVNQSNPILMLDTEVIRDLIFWYELHMISLKRKSRIELKDILRYDEPQEGLGGRLKGALMGDD
jgi:hypothetical protein